MKSFTDIQQSKILAKILPIESADMHYVRKTHDFRGNPVDGEWSYPKYGNPNSKHANYIVQNFTSYEKIPCWSLAALLSVMPKILEYGRPILGTNYEGFYFVQYRDASMDYVNGTNCYNNPIDACVEMIVKLKENNLL